MGAKGRLAAAALGLAIKFSTTADRYAKGSEDIGLPKNDSVNIGGYQIIPDNVREFALIEPLSYALLGYAAFGNRFGSGFKANLKRTFLGGYAPIMALREAVRYVADQAGYVGPHGYNPAETVSLLPFSAIMALAGTGIAMGIDRFYSKEEIKKK